MSNITATIGQQNKNSWSFTSSTSPSAEERSFTIGHHDDPTALLSLKISTGLTLRVKPASTALVIVDMQNYFLSTALGRQKAAGHMACSNLIHYAIPAARRAGIQVIWLNWGLTPQDLEEMPPSVTRCFGFVGTAHDSEGDGREEVEEEEIVLDRHGVPRKDRTYAGLGADMGTIHILAEEEGGPDDVNAGGLLMRDTWNAALYPPLQALYAQNLPPAAKNNNNNLGPESHHLNDDDNDDDDSEDSNLPDLWCHKNRMSGLWGETTPLQQLLEERGLSTLFFAGVNTDQCVGGTLTDAFSKGYTCVLLSDGCGTTSPDFAQKAWEYNCENTFGFVMRCRDLYDGIEAVVK